MTEAFKIIITNETVKTSLIVKPNDEQSERLFSEGKFDIFGKSIEETLNDLGLKRVSFKELVPKYKKIRKDDPIVGENCPICYDEFRSGEYKRELNCKHVFHKKCIDKWLKSNPVCPSCRTDLI